MAILARDRFEDVFPVLERKPLYPGQDHMEEDSDIETRVSCLERL